MTEAHELRYNWTAMLHIFKTLICNFMDRVCASNYNHV